MTSIEPTKWDDTVLPFQLDLADVRGRVARLDGVLEGVLSQHSYPPAIEALVAEAVVLTALIGQAIKLRWKLSLQIRGKGAVRIIATDYYGPGAEGEPARIRGWASYDGERFDPATDAFSQIGEGYFAVLIDQGEGSVPYQGLTSLAGGSLTACAEAYFAQSEQLATRFALAFGRSQLPGQAERWRAGGVMVQHMPEASPFVAEPGDKALHESVPGENWGRVNLLLDTVEELELIGPSVAPTDLLVRLFHEERPRAFAAQPVRFGCSCTADKVRQTLSIYSAKDIRTMTTPEGIVTADCQFCGAHYRFDPASLGFEATLAADGSPLPGKSGD